MKQIKLGNTLLKDKLVASILIIDDQPANLRVLATMLEEQNYKVKKAIDGESALLAAQSTPPDLILLDIKMPDMDGYEICDHLKSNPITKNIPIIFISALAEISDKIKAFKGGGIDYITKPFHEQEVLARISNQLIIQQQKQLLQKEKESLEKEIRKRKETESILYQSRALIASILNSSLDGIAALESIRNTRTGIIEDFRCLVVNPVIAEVFNQQPDNLIGKLVFKKFMNRINPELFDGFVKVVTTGEPLEKDFEYNYKQEQRWYHFIAVKLGDGFSITVREITERKRLELELEKLASIDGLTGVANRRIFDTFLAQEWKRCLREKQPLSLILCDLDYFKLYNDYYGHQQGDDCLIQVAQTMSNIIKRNTDLLARYGGEEFGIILSHTDTKGAIKLAESIRSEVENLKITHKASKAKPYITISLGIATLIPTQAGSPQTLLENADRALYQAKQQGRDRWKHF